MGYIKDYREFIVVYCMQALKKNVIFFVDLKKVFMPTLFNKYRKW